ncbi:flagella basal body P-ring formation protein FlgA [Desulfuromusa kysingii]|uniref:Flagella basal body P-ring formation protein FlgA n=1 Tax=Desulfuromusa kysingii TaxID=37625 RepID=A0A1H3VGB4_9BACT|nr:flagellar basal body P-ring formation chaperone FlgA [Desulfuromusa kysingii]SDZ73833.1 flagella basal body P-ring formation protein FlgA [Desulfuromusa kysingii]
MKYLLSLFLILALPLTVFAATGQSTATTGPLINQQEMKQILNDYLAEQSLSLPQVDLHFKSVKLPEPYRVPAGRISHEVIPAKPGMIGSRRVTLMTRVDGQIISNQSIRVELEAMAEVAIATSSLRRGEILDAGNFELQYQDISKLKDPIFAAEDIIGKRLKRSIRLGEPLQINQVEFPPVIKRGERVTIQVQSMGLMLSAAGEAKQDGSTGEAIRVMNSNSHKEILCQVVAPGLVKVEL